MKKETLKKNLVRKFRKQVYEPEHIKAPCWCSTTWRKEEDGKMHIYHTEQRDLLSLLLEKAIDEVWEKAQEEEQDKILATQFTSKRHD